MNDDRLRTLRLSESTQPSFDQTGALISALTCCLAKGRLKKKIFFFQPM